MVYEILDAIPGWVLLAGMAATLLAAAEAAYRLGRRSRFAAEVITERKSHANIVVAALLALLGLLLAFSFSIVESRYLQRKALVLEEANAIGTTFLRAGMLPPPHGERVQALLRDYVSQRLEVAGSSNAQQALEESERLHDDLWSHADAAAQERDSPVVAIFVQSLNEVIDLHEERVTVALHNRLPAPILLTLLVVSVLSMAVLGYSTGLGGTRALIPTAALILAASVVLVLIVELDRPWARLFAVDKHALVDVQETISRTD